jgi:hypothetical protein
VNSSHPLRGKSLEEAQFAVVPYYTPAMTIGEALSIF